MRWGKEEGDEVAGKVLMYIGVEGGCVAVVLPMCVQTTSRFDERAAVVGLLGTTQE